MAGAGIRPGFSYGSTDDFSYNVAENPVHVRDLHATALNRLELITNASLPISGLGFSPLRSRAGESGQGDPCLRFSYSVFSLSRKFRFDSLISQVIRITGISGFVFGKGFVLFFGFSLWFCFALEPLVQRSR